MNNLDAKKDRVLNVWVLTDGRPGHANQSEGLVEAISKYREVSISRPPLLTTLQALKMWLFNWCFKNKKEDAPDLIVGAGHQTHLSLLAYRRCFGGKVVVMMSPSLPSFFFDLCFIPRHDNPGNRSNIIETVGAINRVVPNTTSSVKDTGLIMLGGPSKHYQWSSKKLIKQIQNVLTKQPEIQWVIAGSRRTPQDTYDEVKTNFPELVLIVPENVSSDWLPQKMHESEQVWVTADSISMIYEALTSGAKAGVIELDYDKPSRITKEIDRLISEGAVDSLNTLDRPHTVTELYEADRCAKLLLEKFEL
ncbi:ELM1/GtrOC1 family putative glycosyltransferase [Cocleimonas sp. KMM 6892]|uniref:mitochondrial fission ELM1 family protein n=1 Tax=unclassified Cocleimonas TaxID=2639732 RepID=UPI002DBEB181|nr:MULTISPECIES: ELM1/GtrOC1 family putative glycosyltransferase [unclassified Cocleimonas]MEB8432553.1 ELM1/GtrOC1 family putative glycosyltransferase [Cocleimonas sp. KMM 6892]MEC4715412.1 ELM1/GtrOC1 family putative glycosyltransferase [Cocleimonas sp. KMM 6895]MEC4744969.1 ELM1/GtrOC1 family putative glycosyltransferase [Cocleimonas sp. KMM 6896]